MNEIENKPPNKMLADGGRFLPGVMHGSIELEHMHRYNFSSQFVSGKVVLDIASGEGYGSDFLARFAKHIIGVDISMTAAEYANTKYSRDNLEYRVGSCSEIPLPDAAVDVVVSFETIEHHDEHDIMMREIKRVLRPGGLLVISSPDRKEYSDKAGFRNPFHVRELYRDEFQALLNANFKNVSQFGQRVILGSALLHQGGPGNLIFSQLGDENGATLGLSNPLYWVAVASDNQLSTINGGVLEQSVGNLWGTC